MLSSAEVHGARFFLAGVAVIPSARGIRLKVLLGGRGAVTNPETLSFVLT